MENNGLNLADVAEVDKNVIKESGLWGMRENESPEMPA